MGPRARVLPLLALLGALAACGKSPIETGCAKRDECKLLLAGQTEQQCIADAEKYLDNLRATGNCTAVLAKYDALLDCSGTLSCADAAKEPRDTKCAPQYADFVGVYAMSKCNLQGGIMQMSGGSSTGSTSSAGGAGGM
jgi:hypothetical protein